MKKTVIFIIILLIFIIVSVLAFNFSGIDGFAVKNISKCYDSDNGNEPFIQGVVEYKKYLFWTKTYGDKCINENRLREYFCEKNKLKTEIHNCENGCGNDTCLKGVKEEPCSNDGQRECFGNGYRICNVYTGAEDCPGEDIYGKEIKCFKWGEVFSCPEGCENNGYCKGNIVLNCSLEQKNGLCGYKEDILPSILEIDPYKVLSQPGKSFEDEYFQFVANFPNNIEVGKPFTFTLSITNKQGTDNYMSYRYSTPYPDYYELMDVSSGFRRASNGNDLLSESFYPYETKNITIRLTARYTILTVWDPYIFEFYFLNKDNRHKDLVFTPYIKRTEVNSIKCGNNYFSGNRPPTSPVEFSNIMGGAPKRVNYDKGICCNNIFYPSVECCGDSYCMDSDLSNGYCVDGICMNKAGYKNKLYGTKKISFIVIGNSETCEEINHPEYSELVSITNQFFDVMAKKILNKESDFVNFNLDKIIIVPTNFEGDFDTETSLYSSVFNSCNIDLSGDDIVIAEENLLREDLRFGSFAEGTLIGGKGNGKLVFMKGHGLEGNSKGEKSNEQIFPIFNKCTFVHEIGHVFGCRDLYSDLGGILQWGNTLYGLNKEISAAAHVKDGVCDMVMTNRFSELRADSLLVCKGDLGWTDLNNNGIVDVME